MIVVLLALLTPALDQAVYQAQLTRCAANQHAAASGATTYAVHHKRRYPYRSTAANQNKGPFYLKTPSGGSVDISGYLLPDQRFDDRIPLRDYVDLKALEDPMAGDIDLATEQSDYIWSAYCLWFGFRYTYIVGVPQGVLGGQGMYKMGDRWTWSIRSSDATYFEHRFNILVSDLDLVEESTGLVENAHQDRDGLLAASTHQDRRAMPNERESGNTATYSYWRRTTRPGGQGPLRGHGDFNAALEDGSTHRYAEVPWDDQDVMVRVPEYPNVMAYSDRRINVPKK